MEASSSGVSGSSSAGSSPSPSSAPTSAPASSGSPSTSSPSGSGSSAPDREGLPSVQSVGGPGSEQVVDKLPGETQAEAIERKYKLKVNGREIEVDEQTLVRKAQMAEAADARFREAAELRKQTDAFMEALRSDPFAALEQAGMDIDLDSLAEQRLVAKLQKEMMSPEQRELDELRRFKQQQDEARQAGEQEQTTRQQQQAMQEMQARASEQYDRDLTEALSASDLPKDPDTVKAVAGLLLNAMKNGYELDPKTAVDMVRERFHGGLQNIVSKLEGDKLVKFLGEDTIKRMRQHDLAALKAKLAQSQPAPMANPFSHSPQPAPGAEKLSMDQWLERARQKAGV